MDKLTICKTDLSSIACFTNKNMAIMLRKIPNTCDHILIASSIGE